MSGFVHELRVRYGECDPQGIVFNPNYLAYFDHTVSELWRASELGSWDAMVERGVDVVVAEANVRFRSPARFEDVIAIRAVIAHFGTTSLKLELEVHRGDELLVEGWLRQVFVDAKTWRKTPIPDWVRAALEPFAATKRSESTPAA
jgi:acyl-CoA thioester hydrolase